MTALDDPLAIATIVFAAVAFAIMLWFLSSKPALVTSTKLILFAGILIFPICAAFTGNLHGYSVSQERGFCGGCHVMVPYTDDSNDPASKTLAAMHSKNPLFGERNCYTCHADYGMFGSVVTKINGLHHVYAYYRNFSHVPVEEALPKIELYKPFDNAVCMHCHSTRTERWSNIKDHRGADQDVRNGKLSCASDGCHGPAHPFRERAREAKTP